MMNVLMSLVLRVMPINETMRCVMQAEQLSLAFLLQLPHGTEWAFIRVK